MENVTLNEGFSQICVWEGTTVGIDKIAKFEEFIKAEFRGARAQYLEEIITKPTPGEAGTGGRTDVFFAIHNEDVMKFAVPRLAYGIHWIEDVYGNGNGVLYPERCAKYQSWKSTDDNEEDDYET